MKKILKFKLKVNSNLVDYVDVIDKNIYFNINNNIITMTSLCKKFENKLICDECDSETLVKSLQPYIVKNKKFICRKCRNTGERNGMYGKKHSEEVKKNLVKID